MFVDEELHESLIKPIPVPVPEPEPVKPRVDEYVQQPVSNGPEGSNIEEEVKDFFATNQYDYMHASQG